MAIELDARPIVEVETKPAAARRSRAADPDSDESSAISRADHRLRMINLGAVLVPIVGLIVAMTLLWRGVFNGVYLAIMAVMSFVSGFGVAAINGVENLGNVAHGGFGCAWDTPRSAKIQGLSFCVKAAPRRHDRYYSIIRTKLPAFANKNGQ